MDHVTAVRTAIKLVADPGPFLDVRKFPESTDIIYVLGEQFTEWNLTSKEIPALKWNSVTFYEVAPWNDKRIVTLQCKTDPKNGFRVSVFDIGGTNGRIERVLEAWSVGE